MDKVSVFLLLLLAILLSSCGIYNHYGFDYNQLSRLERGMTFDEVTAVLGEPTFRDFDDEGETLIFRALGNTGWAIVKVRFKEGKVAGMKSYIEDTYSERPSSTINSVDEKKDISNKDTGSKVIVAPDGKHYIKMGSVVVTPEGKHIIIP